MEKNIVEQVIIPEVPKVIPNQQTYVYIPIATLDTKGIASYDSVYFTVTSGHVTLKTTFVDLIQLKYDERLNTNGKEVVGAINELKESTDTLSEAKQQHADKLVSLERSDTLINDKIVALKAADEVFNEDITILKTHDVEHDNRIADLTANKVGKRVNVSAKPAAYVETAHSTSDASLKEINDSGNIPNKGDLISAEEGGAIVVGEPKKPQHAATRRFVIEAIAEVEAVAKGAQTSLVYDDYANMIDALNVNTTEKHAIGTNIYLREVNVPDLWISRVLDYSVQYEYISDEVFLSDLNTNKFVRIGCYEVSQLEGQKGHTKELATKEQVDVVEEKVDDIIDAITDDIAVKRTIESADDVYYVNIPEIIPTTGAQGYSIEARDLYNVLRMANLLPPNIISASTDAVSIEYDNGSVVCTILRDISNEYIDVIKLGDCPRLYPYLAYFWGIKLTSDYDSWAPRIEELSFVGIGTFSSSQPFSTTKVWKGRGLYSDDLSIRFLITSATAGEQIRLDIFAKLDFGDITGDIMSEVGKPVAEPAIDKITFNYGASSKTFDLSLPFDKGEIYYPLENRIAVYHRKLSANWSVYSGITGYDAYVTKAWGSVGIGRMFVEVLDYSKLGTPYMTEHLDVGRPVMAVDTTNDRIIVVLPPNTFSIERDVSVMFPTLEIIASGQLSSRAVDNPELVDALKDLTDCTRIFAYSSENSLIHLNQSITLWVQQRRTVVYVNGNPVDEFDADKYVKFTDIASNTKHGVVRVEPWGDITVDNNGTIYAQTPTNQMIDERYVHRLLRCSNVDYIGMSALAECKKPELWTDDTIENGETVQGTKTKARELLGAVGKEDYATTDKWGLVLKATENYIVNSRYNHYIDAYYLPYGVRHWLTHESGTFPWTDEQRALACELLGAVKKQTPTSDSVYIATANGDIVVSIGKTSSQAGSMVQRDNEGCVHTNPPTKRNHATPKWYVDTVDKYTEVTLDFGIGIVVDTSTLDTSKVYKLDILANRNTELVKTDDTNVTIEEPVEITGTLKYVISYWVFQGYTIKSDNTIFTFLETRMSQVKINDLTGSTPYYKLVEIA